MPDAPLPDSGASVRAYVRLDALGLVDQVSVTAPADLPSAFADVVGVGLRQSHLRAALGAEENGPHPSGLAYCLSIRFDPSEPRPSIRWLPGVARDAARCLNSQAPTKATDIARR